MENLILSPLNHTWFLDLDGTLVVHNGYKIYGYDILLEGAREFLNRIPADDMIIIITSRTDEYKEITEAFLSDEKIRYDTVIYSAPFGERIVVNDRKPSGLSTALAVNINRDERMKIEFEIKENI
jgi:hypothetical protein